MRDCCCLIRGFARDGGLNCLQIIYFFSSITASNYAVCRGCPAPNLQQVTHRKGKRCHRRSLSAQSFLFEAQISFQFSFFLAEQLQKNLPSRFIIRWFEHPFFVACYVFSSDEDIQCIRPILRLHARALAPTGVASQVGLQKVSRTRQKAMLSSAQDGSGRNMDYFYFASDLEPLACHRCQCHHSPPSAIASRTRNCRNRGGTLE